MPKPKKSKPKTIEFNPVCDPQAMHGYRNVRWIENASCGLRLVGFADEIGRLNHKGWYTEDDGDSGEVYRGIVYQLPSRKGKTLFVYGYADPNNDDCALLSFDPEETKEEAARAADRFAEIFADNEREYQRAWQAGRRYEDLDESVKDMRSEALHICAEIRQSRRLATSAPTICRVLRDKVHSLYRQIQKARKERKTLLDDYGRQPGFQE